MRILVTGAAGAVGSHIAEALARLGHEVVGLDAFTPYYDPEIKRENARQIEKSGVRIIEADLVNADLSKIVDGVEVIYHFAAQPGISSTTSFNDYLNNNIVATHRLVESVSKSLSLKLFVHISTSSVYGKEAVGDEETVPKPSSHYGVTKLAAEQLVLALNRDKGFPATVLRLFSVYGERERPEKLYSKIIKCALEKKPFTLYDGALKHRRSYTYISDVVDACLAILHSIDRVKGEIFNIGVDETITTGEGIAIIESIVGPIQYTHLPKRAGDQLETRARIDKARKIIGYDPKVTPKEGLRRQVAWYLSSLHKE